MTRSLSSEMVTLLDGSEFRPAFLIEAEFEDSTGTDATLRLWTGMGSLAYDGKTWTGTGDILTVEGFEEILETVSRGASFTLSGIGDAAVNGNGDSIIDLALRTEYQSRPITMYLALFDADWNLAGAFVYFGGFMDVMEVQEDGREAIITLSAENALVALERKVGRTYTAEDHKEQYPADTFFDQVAELQNMEIRLEA